MKKILPILVYVLFVSCAGKKGPLADPEDYNVFLRGDLQYRHVTQARQELSSREQHLQRDTGNFADMMEIASAHLALFRLTGEVNDLHTGDSLLLVSLSKLNSTDPEMLFALSQAAIIQHQFRNASFYNEAAGKAKGGELTTNLLAFDAAMELGEYEKASGKLEAIKDKTSFEYLARKARLENQKGDPGKAIVLMEQASGIIKDKNKALYCWALSSLADMYGHAGRVKESYNAYLDVLKNDSSYLYALKGIAWIAYSHDKNTADAKRILKYILSQSKMPDLWLTLAEIEEWEGNVETKMVYINRFINEVERPGYGNMYNKYLIQLYTGEMLDLDKAMQLAEYEIANRPTPETYGWLAWVHFKKGDLQKAIQLTMSYVYRVNFEPDAVLHTALIFAANGKKKEALVLLKDCEQNSFEIGPVTADEVKRHLWRLETKP